MGRAARLAILSGGELLEYVVRTNRRLVLDLATETVFRTRVFGQAPLHTWQPSSTESSRGLRRFYAPAQPQKGPLAP